MSCHFQRFFALFAVLLLSIGTATSALAQTSATPPSPAPLLPDPLVEALRGGPESWTSPERLSSTLQVMLLLTALTYFQSGVHLDRAMFWAAGFVVVGFLAPFVLTAWVWTAVGAALAAGMATLAFVSWRRGGRAAA